MERDDICGKCKVPCCKVNAEPYIHKDELKFLPKVNVRKINENLYQIIKTKKGCPFLIIKGCSLKKKPLACRIYPFILFKGRWMIRTCCPHWNEYTNEDLDKVKKLFEENKQYWCGK